MHNSFLFFYLPLLKLRFLDVFCSMKNSVSSDCEMNDPVFDDFDPRLNFSKFLEEAKHHATEQETGAKWLPPQKKSKKSWKNTLFSWLKSDKRTKPLPKPGTNPHIPNTRRVHVSGPIFTRATAIDGRSRGGRSTSGPIASLFSPSLSSEMEIPYMCLHQLTSPNTNHNYGPIYLVT
ncbi:uncharacterized protein LOC111790969 [Cucurbita pepo subsp. pepo]|uniref:uncharacterized protein LOC111790969 n=1 Tax=Cucurbita pepo subsp. pepo TaxID=3664 RepID=UPI000C9D8AA1|nr:uncharacterized protein LOC111790969 [Cucurbita pepo subsp. pepo]